MSLEVVVGKSVVPVHKTECGPRCKWCSVSSVVQPCGAKACTKSWIGANAAFTSLSTYCNLSTSEPRTVGAILWSHMRAPSPVNFDGGSAGRSTCRDNRQHWNIQKKRKKNSQGPANTPHVETIQPATQPSAEALEGPGRSNKPQTERHVTGFEGSAKLALHCNLEAVQPHSQRSCS